MVGLRRQPVVGLRKRLAAGIPLQLADTAEDEAALGRGWLEVQGGLVSAGGLGGTAKPAEQVSAGEMKLRPAAKLGMAADGIQDDEARGRPFRHGDRDGPVRLHHRRGLVAEQFPVQRRDFPPVGLCRRTAGGVAGGDRRVQLVRAGPACPQGAYQQLLTLADHRGIPLAAVLVGQQHQFAG